MLEFDEIKFGEIDEMEIDESNAEGVTPSNRLQH